MTYVENEVFEKHRSEDKESRHAINTLLTKHSIILARIDEKVGSIEIQTKKTNGKVAELSGWKMYITGGLAILTIVTVCVLIPLSLSFANHYLFN